MTENLTSREGCSCGTDATSLNPAEAVVHRHDGPCYITQNPRACVAQLTDAFMAAWDTRGEGVASEHAVESMRSALVQTGWLSTSEGDD